MHDKVLRRNLHDISPKFQLVIGHWNRDASSLKPDIELSHSI